MVLDDYHVIEDLAVHESVSFWLAHRPPALRVIIAGRADPPLALARLRGRGELGEVRAGDLRFTSAEAGELLRRAGVGTSTPLPDTTVTALAARTEGWAAGLQLAALSLRGRSDVAGFVDAFTGSHRYILDYLAEEVLERQSPEMRRFLLETSLLERLSGSLCDAVTGRTDSQARLEQVERAGLFLAPLDDIRQWWRYHHLFSDLLRARLGPAIPAKAGRPAPPGRRLVRGAPPCRRRHPPRAGRRGDDLGGPAHRNELRHPLQPARRGNDDPSVAGLAGSRTRLPTRFVRVFADEGPAMASLLASLMTAQAPTAVTRLCRRASRLGYNKPSNRRGNQQAPSPNR